MKEKKVNGKGIMTKKNLNIKEYKNYSVTVEGNIYSNYKMINEPMGGDKDNKVTLTSKEHKELRPQKIKKDFCVMITFSPIDEPENYTILHKDGNIFNNALENLEWKPKKGKVIEPELDFKDDEPEEEKNEQEAKKDKKQVRKFKMDLEKYDLKNENRNLKITNKDLLAQVELYKKNLEDSEKKRMELAKEHHLLYKQWEANKMSQCYDSEMMDDANAFRKKLEEILGQIKELVGNSKDTMFQVNM